MPSCRKPQLVGINHVAIEVGDIDRALAFYGEIFDFTLRAKRPGNAFIELGDQFINIVRDQRRRTRMGAAISGSSSTTDRACGHGSRPPAASLLPGPFLDFLDPWGNRVEIIEYAEHPVHQGAAVSCARWGSTSTRTRRRRRELADKGMTP